MTQHSVHHDAKHLPPHELTRLYGIYINPDGSVEDPTSGQLFESLTAWADFETEQEEGFEGEVMERFHRGGNDWE